MATKLQVLQEHCRRFEDRLESCTGPQQAEATREQVCRELGAACHSELLQGLLQEHASELIRQRFGVS